MPEFHQHKSVEWEVHVTPQKMHYDIIIGQDLMTELGIIIDYKNHQISWDDATISMKQEDALPPEFFALPVPKEDIKKMKSILDAKYSPADLKQVVQDCTHLTTDEQQQLSALLHQYKDLFDGSLGHWQGPPYDIKLKNDAQPYHARPYPIPKAYEKTFKMEVERLCTLGVLKKVNRSEWAAPTFIIPKKDQTVRFISDFRELNKRIRRIPFPIPKIQDLMLKLEGFQYGTSLDLNMGYYHIELSPSSKRLCTIVLPWGKYEYQRLPMGLCNSPDIFQERMSTLMQDLEYVRTYIDDLLCITSGDWQDHLVKLKEVFQCLRDAGLKVNANKSFFGKSELEYLGFWVTRKGIQPVAKKITAIQQIAPPKTR